MKYSEYKDGLNMKGFDHIKQVSIYNHNYYVGMHGDLLFGKSDDDNTTDWWVVSNQSFVYLGESYTSEGEILHRFEEQQT